MPLTAFGVDSPYDEFATTWDRGYGMDSAETRQVTDLIRETFADRLGRTLDVGCGTGFPLDGGLAEAVRYVGIDPSTGMLNALVMKHPILAGVHPMTYAEAERRGVLCGTRFDTVLATGGSASYLSAADIETLRLRAKRGLVLVHFADGMYPATKDLDSRVASDSLNHAMTVAQRTVPIGRFVANMIPGTCPAIA